MQEFQELIKNFDKIRDYMRQFYLYGFKTRNDFSSKSARTYDNERRRIESFLADYMKSDYTESGKHMYINVDSKAISQNPLFEAWKSKSFTDNDLMLHFFLLDLLCDRSEGMTSGELSDAISSSYGIIFDSQTVRLKLKEYEALGILSSRKSGKSLYYLLHAPLSIEPGFSQIPGLWEKLLTALKFFQEAAPLGVIGSTILDRESACNECFQFKHHFIVHTLEDGILIKILTAIRQHRRISFQNNSHRSGNTTKQSGIPIKIFVSTRTGRRYVCLYRTSNRRFLNIRLDCISEVIFSDIYLEYEERQTDLLNNIDRCFGVSFGDKGRLEELILRLYIDEEKEPYILKRLYREGRGGEITRIKMNEYEYRGEFFDTNEMLPWVKSFTGRILEIRGSNPYVTAKVKRDLRKMYQMYCQDAGI